MNVPVTTTAGLSHYRRRTHKLAREYNKIDKFLYEAVCFQFSPPPLSFLSLQVQKTYLDNCLQNHQSPPLFSINIPVSLCFFFLPLQAPPKWQDNITPCGRNTWRKINVEENNVQSPIDYLNFPFVFPFPADKNSQKKDLGNIKICIEQWLRILIMNTKRRQHQQKI